MNRRNPFDNSVYGNCVGATICLQIIAVAAAMLDRMYDITGEPIDWSWWWVFSPSLFLAGITVALGVWLLIGIAVEGGKARL